MCDVQAAANSLHLFATAIALPNKHEQVIWNPIFGVMFFSYLGLTEGKSAAQIVDKIQADLQTAVMGSWAVWIPAHTINFRYVLAYTAI
jgi:Mpv17 / PMP22 family